MYRWEGWGGTEEEGVAEEGREEEGVGGRVRMWWDGVGVVVVEWRGLEWGVVLRVLWR